MKVLVTGASGLIGSALCDTLVEKGHDVGRLQRREGAPGKPWWDLLAGEVHLGAFSGPDAVVHLAGDNIASGRWTAAKKKRIRESRVLGTELLVDHLAKLEKKPRVLLSASAIGYYGDCGDRTLSEEAPAGSDFLAEVCEQWEAATAAAGKAGIRVVRLRTGVVLSGSGGALQKMLTPFKLGVGGILGDGSQYMSWISIQDVVGSLLWLLEQESIAGPVNLVSPTAVTNLQFTKALGKVLSRPTIFPMPAPVVRLLFGQMGEELLLASTRVTPQVLEDGGYTFQHTALEDALRHVLQRR